MRQTIALISLHTIVKNAMLVKERAGVPLIAVVKDDAYGHGAERVALALHGVASSFAVSCAAEGAALRVAGVQEDILVLSPALSEEEALLLAAHRLTPTLGSFASLRLFARAVKAPFPAHIAVNTGMNRGGFPPKSVPAACREAKDRGIEVRGVYSHLYAPELPAARERQLRLFSDAAEEVRVRFPRAVRHLAATGGLLAGKEFAFDAVRSGIALYGYLPEGFGDALPLTHAMKVYSAVSWRGTFLGGGIGYGEAARAYGKLHTLRFGYGSGFFRTAGKGEGNLCMDACVRTGDAPFGAKRLILGDAAAYARAAGTSAYEVLVRVGREAEKYYV